MKNEIKKKLNTSELLHLWCNKQITEDKILGNYRFTPTELYCKNSLVAILVKNKYFFVKIFDNVGSYGKGFSSYSILRFIPDKYWKSEVKKLPSFEMDNEFQIKWLQEEFINIRERLFRDYSYLKQVAKNSWTKNIPQLEDLNNVSLEKSKSYLKLFNKEVVKEFYKRKLSYEYCLEKWNGWSRNDMQRYYEVINFTPRQIINNKLINNFTKEELEIINFKHWRNTYLTKAQKYGYGSFIYDLKESKAIYFDLEKRELHEEHYKNRKAEVELAKKRKEESSLIVKLKAQESNELKFRSNASTSYYFNYPVLKLVNKVVTGQYVRTSIGVTIEVEEAKKALKLFLKFKDKEYKGENSIANWKVIGIREVEVPTLDDTENAIIYQKEKALVIGCHEILESEIYKFLDFYKLNWI